jgi:hypothetical protein
MLKRPGPKPPYHALNNIDPTIKNWLDVWESAGKVVVMRIDKTTTVADTPYRRNEERSFSFLSTEKSITLLLQGQTPFNPLIGYQRAVRFQILVVIDKAHAQRHCDRAMAPRRSLVSQEEWASVLV